MFLLWPRCWAGVCPWESQGAYGVGAESCFLTWHWLGPWWARGSFLCCSQPLLQCGFQCLLVAPHVQTKGRSFLYPLVSLRLLLVGAKFLLGSTEVDVFKNWKGSSIFASSTVTIFFLNTSKTGHCDNLVDSMRVWYLQVVYLMTYLTLKYLGSLCFSFLVKMAEGLKERMWLTLFPFKFCFWIKCEFPMPISLSFLSHCCCHLQWLPQDLVY